MKPDGSTTGGCWIYTGVYADGVNQSMRRKPGREQSWVAPEWGWAWPMNRRTLYNRASADPDGKPWSERKAYVWWDEEAQKWTGHDVPDFEVGKAPSYRPPAGASGPAGLRRRRPVHHAGGREGLALRPDRPAGRAAADALRAAGVPGQQPDVAAAVQPDAGGLPAPGQPAEPLGRRAGLRALPVRVHHLPADRAPHGRRDEPLGSPTWPSCSRSSSARSRPSWPASAAW